MCLYTKQTDLLKADEDITCYKIIFKTKDGDLITPSQGTLINDIVEPFVASGNVNAVPYRKINGVPHYTIGGGLIHTYASLKHAYFDKPIMSEYHNDAIIDAMIFECIIPKGTYYYSGWHRFAPGYASKQIKFIKEIKNFSELLYRKKNMMFLILAITKKYHVS